MATLFSLISCLDFLERAYVRGAIGEDEYTPACARLLGQYKTVIKLITDPTKPAPFRFDNIEAFMAYYDVRIQAHADGLPRSGAPPPARRACHRGARERKQAACCRACAACRGDDTELYYAHGCAQAQDARQGPTAPPAERPAQRLYQSRCSGRRGAREAPRVVRACLR